MLSSPIETREDEHPIAKIVREIGAELRRARIKRGEALEDVARQLHIKGTYLYGLEHGDLGVMPGVTYTLGFLRSYADHLGFDGGQIVTRLKPEITKLAARSAPVARPAEASASINKASVLMVLLAILAGVGAGWLFLHRASQPLAWLEQEKAPAAAPAEAPATPAEPAPATSAEPTVEATAPAPPAAPAPTEQPPLEAADGGAAAELAAAMERLRAGAGAGTGAETTPSLGQVEPAPADEVDAAAAPQPATEALPAEPAADAGAQVAALATRGLVIPSAPAEQAGEEPGLQAADALAALARQEADAAANAASTLPTRITLRAVEGSWVQVSSADRSYLWSRTLRAGDTFSVPNRNDLQIWTGNAGGIEILVDGKPAPALGPRGMVIRGQPLDAEVLMAKASAPTTPAPKPPGIKPTF